MQQQQNPNGTVSTWAWDNRGLLAGIRHGTSGGADLGVDVYTYDAVANPVSKRTLGGWTTWTYDPVNELTSEQHELGVITTWGYL
jgi:hypothetical protein